MHFQLLDVQMPIRTLMKRILYDTRSLDSPALSVELSTQLLRERSTSWLVVIRYQSATWHDCTTLFQHIAQDTHLAHAHAYLVLRAPHTLLSLRAQHHLARMGAQVVDEPLERGALMTALRTLETMIVSRLPYECIPTGLLKGAERIPALPSWGDTDPQIPSVRR